MKAARALVLAASSTLALPVAAAPPQVEVTVDPCLASERAQILSILTLELDGSVLEVSDSAAATNVRLDCSAADAIEIGVSGGPGDRPLTRTLGLRGVQARARPRLVALAVVELVAVSLAERERERRRAPAPPAAAPVAAHPPSLPVVAARPVVAPLDGASAVAFVQTRIVPDRAALWGLGLRASREQGDRARGVVDLVVERGSRQFAAGTLTLDALSLGTAALVALHAGRLVAHVGGGVRVGALRIAGTPSDRQLTQGRDLFAGWGGPQALATLSTLLARHLAVELGLEGGYAIFGARGRADDGGGLGLAAGWLALTLAVGYGS